MRSPSTISALRAGAAVTDLTPRGSVFLYGYPHVARNSTGVHDPLQCAALYLEAGAGRALFLANDLIHVSRPFAHEVRNAIATATGVPVEAVLISATHTHSGPVMVDHVSNAADAAVPKADSGYVGWAAKQMIAAARAAVASAQPAELGFAVARAKGVGSNRHDPSGPADPDVPFLIVRPHGGGLPLAAMLVYAMHPTVLHEDSTLISGDFPHFTRRYLQERVLGAGCPVLYHNGASGNQSPRHVTRENTFAEAQRLGELLGQAVADVLPGMRFVRELRIAARSRLLELTLRAMPSPEEARRALAAARDRFTQRQQAGAPRADVRTAECDVFGAEETAELAQAQQDGRLAAAGRGCSPAEIQVFEIGPWRLVAWPGEFFVEYALEVKRRSPNTFVITLANGELQAYIVTPEAARRGVYEATNAIFAAENGARVVEATLALLGEDR